MSGLMAYWLAWQYTQHVVDRSLADLATAISRQIQLAGVDAPVTVPAARAGDVLRSDRATDLPHQRRRERNRRRARSAAHRHERAPHPLCVRVRNPLPGLERARGAGARRPAARQSDRRRSGAARRLAISHRGRVPVRDHDAAAAAAAGGLGDRVARREPAAQSADRSRRHAQSANAYLARTGRRNARAGGDSSADERDERPARTTEDRARRTAQIHRRCRASVAHAAHRREAARRAGDDRPRSGEGPRCR